MFRTNDATQVIPTTPDSNKPQLILMLQVLPVHERVLDVLFKPSKTYEESEIPQIAEHFSCNEVEILIWKVRDLLVKEDTLHYVQAPCRVVTDLHGQFADLMNFFAWHGAPDGSMPWVFIGDFVDRTLYGCEVLMLLYALKIKWPQHIVLLRGNHEIAWLNERYGFKVRRRKGERYADADPGGNCKAPGDSCIVPCRYLLVHGGIGRVETLAQIAAAKRPITGDAEGGTFSDKIMSELVWSDPATSDTHNGILRNVRDGNSGGIVTFGADRATAFCERNRITAILRGHQVPNEGLEPAFGGRVLTFCSAVNFAGKYTNHGCILHLALTADEGGMPTIEIQPQRLLAKPLLPKPPPPTEPPLAQQLVALRDALVGHAKPSAPVAVAPAITADTVEKLTLDTDAGDVNSVMLDLKRFLAGIEQQIKIRKVAESRQGLGPKLRGAHPEADEPLRTRWNYGADRDGWCLDESTWLTSRPAFPRGKPWKPYLGPAEMLVCRLA
ncbi:hypothetical protein GPECTOR_22g862 [Gonium pectorale]|uniref:Serine/threonine-protein phosphatase n=1 Tax=Gonium pectorale TaxID=33097 RepID=A0A150GHK1_GONPE|nr:hypothetical protein GPECTOR_22g862 [Gonium pectorale]|eukprot:KXZ49269.1 hypothetical protein GPECTOR_22g862 [Gonium pectorale]